MGHYPSDVVLREISSFDIFTRDVNELLQLIKNEWEYEECGGFKLTEGKERTLELNTFGWSGNEDIISALQTNFVFWSCFWEMTKKGGHYFFTIKEIPKAEEKHDEKKEDGKQT